MSSIKDANFLNSSIDDFSPLISQVDEIDSCIENLSPSIFMYKPKVPKTETISGAIVTLQDPNLIILFTWTGAQRKHITKYISGYTTMFPSSPIIVITTSINDLTYRTSSKKRRSLLPAITTIANSPRLNANILLHLFSEGGSSTSVHFAKAFRTHTRRCLPIAGLVCDSCPGTLHFTNLAHTARNTVPKNNPTAQVVASLTAYTIIASYWMTFLLIGDREDVDDPKDLNAKTKLALNDRSLWNTTAPRAYLFSKADKLIDWKTVLEHARDAESRDTPVFVELFGKSAHCAHIRDAEDAERYWRAVQKVWDTRTNGPSDGVESMDGKKDVVDVKVRELGLQARRPVKKRCTCLDCGR